MIRTRAVLRLPGVVALCACANSLTGTAGEFQFASATNSCAPTDAPAVSITLSPRPIGASPVDQPFLTVSLWTGLGNLTGRTFRFARESNDGFGEYVADTDPRAGPVTGTVVVNGVARDSSIIGSIDVRLIDGTRLVREFAARFRPSHTRCG